MNIRYLIAAFLLAFHAMPVCAETIKIAGSGGMIPLVTELARAYMRKYPGETVEVDQRSMGMIGGILAVKSGAVDIGMTAKRMRKDMQSLQLKAYEIARVPVEFGVNRNVSVTRITSRQLCDVYSGKITNWRQLGGNDSPIMLLSRPRIDATYVAVVEGIRCFSDIKEAQKALIEPTSMDMAEDLATKLYSIGMVDSIAIAKSGGKIKPLAIDGKKPSGDGNWPIVKEYTLVVGKKRTLGIKQFLLFVRSPEGEAIIKRNGAIPTKFAPDL